MVVAAMADAARPGVNVLPCPGHPFVTRTARSRPVTAAVSDPETSSEAARTGRRFDPDQHQYE